MNDGFPKLFRVADKGGAWPFTGATAFDAYRDKTKDIYEVPIGGSGQVWETFGKSPRHYRVNMDLLGLLRSC